MKIVAMISMVVGAAFWSWWFTPDQQGDRLMEDGKFEEAAEVYRDPMRAGVAWYRAGKFEKSGQAFARVSTPEGAYNRGNALIFRGLYEDAVVQFDRALQARPGWEDAQVNRRIAVARAAATKAEGGDMGDQTIGADEIKFDKKKPGGQETRIQKEQAANDKGVQAMWLRKVETNPGDFLRAKFSYQDAMGEEGEP